MLRMLLQQPPHPEADAVLHFQPKATQVCPAFFPARSLGSGSFGPHAEVRTNAASNISKIILEANKDVIKTNKQTCFSWFLFSDFLQLHVCLN